MAPLLRLRALENLVCQLGAMLFKLGPRDWQQSALQAILAASKRNVVPQSDPAMSDHYSAEFEAATQRLAKTLQEYMARDD